MPGIAGVPFHDGIADVLVDTVGIKFSYTVPADKRALILYVAGDINNSPPIARWFYEAFESAGTFFRFRGTTGSAEYNTWIVLNGGERLDFRIAIAGPPYFTADFYLAGREFDRGEFQIGV